MGEASLNIFSVPGTALHTDREQQAIWVFPRRFLPQEQLRKVKPATRGASGAVPGHRQHPG